MAVQTQFTMAEAYFELAKKHRSLEQESLARREIAQGKKLLEEALKDYPGTDLRVQAEYLLADLALEYGNDAKDMDMKRKKYYEAVNLFTKIIMTYPDSIYAPKAQYKKALSYENLGEIDQACEEYVKLSYTYPDNELIAETIARLGNYFSAKGKELTAQMEKAANQAEKEKYEKQSRAMYKTAAEVFSRLAPRFPSHNLANKTMVLSGQCYLQANEMEKAVETFQNAIKKIEGDNELMAEAMYWCGDSCLKINKLDLAYRQFKQLTWDYPASKWAKFARGRLTEDALMRYEEIDKQTK
jgi:TolA-binding protein